jgi:MFS family permease
MMNMGGNLAGVLSPIVFGAIVQAGSWSAPFYVEAGFLAVGGFVFAFLLNPEKSVVEKYAASKTHDSYDSHLVG